MAAVWWFGVITASTHPAPLANSLFLLCAVFLAQRPPIITPAERLCRSDARPHRKSMIGLFHGRLTRSAVTKKYPSACDYAGGVWETVVHSRFKSLNLPLHLSCNDLCSYLSPVLIYRIFLIVVLLPPRVLTPFACFPPRWHSGQPQTSTPLFKPSSIFSLFSMRGFAWSRIRALHHIVHHCCFCP